MIFYKNNLSNISILQINSKLNAQESTQFVVTFFEKDLYSNQLQTLTIWYLKAELETIEELEIALAKEDFNQLITLGNRIYSHGSSLGFDRVSLIGKKIEMAAIEKNTISLACLFAVLKTHINHLLHKIDTTNE